MTAMIHYALAAVACYHHFPANIYIATKQINFHRNENKFTESLRTSSSSLELTEPLLIFILLILFVAIAFSYLKKYKIKKNYFIHRLKMHFIHN